MKKKEIEELEIIEESEDKYKIKKDNIEYTINKVQLIEAQKINELVRKVNQLKERED